MQKWVNFTINKRYERVGFILFGYILKRTVEAPRIISIILQSMLFEQHNAVCPLT